MDNSITNLLSGGFGVILSAIGFAGYIDKKMGKHDIRLDHLEDYKRESQDSKDSAIMLLQRLDERTELMGERIERIENKLDN